ncbi:MAG: sensor histidine kinase [Mariprofundales bacterium]|nr:sensor histidine kinase [Mariprofundales bacterium]
MARPNQPVRGRCHATIALAALAWPLVRANDGHPYAMKLRRFGTISNHIGVTFLLLLSVALLLILWQSNMTITRTISHGAEISLQSTLHRISAQIDEAMNDQDQAMHLIAASPLLHQRLRQLNQQPGTETLTHAKNDPLQPLITANHIHTMLLIDLQRHIRLRLHTKRNHTLADIANAQQLQQLRTSPFDLLQAITLPPSQDPIDHQGLVWHAMPVIEKGELLGVLAIAIDLTRIDGLVMDPTGLGDSGEVLLTMRQHHSAIAIAANRFDATAAFQQHFTQPNDPSYLAAFGHNGHGDIREYRGNRVLAAWHYLPELHAGLVMQQDRDELLRPAVAMQRQLLIITSITLLLTLLLAWFIGQRIGRPLRKLDEAAKRIAHGDHSWRITPSGSQETQDLGIHFNEMTDALQMSEQALQQTIAGLDLQVAQRTAQLTATNEELKSFAYIVSHDLRAPLVNIRGFSRELGYDMKQVMLGVRPLLGEAANGTELARLADEDVTESLHFIDASVARMEQMIDALLHLSRQGRREMMTEEIDLETLVHQVFDAMGHQLAQHQSSVTIEPLPHIVSDPVALEQIISNIADNAVKYLDPSRQGVITVRGRIEDAMLILAVSDNGIGIPKNQHDKVFQIFRRGNHPQIAGDGMGMAYVSQLIHRLDGNIDFLSTKGEGSTFTIHLPQHAGGKKHGGSHDEHHHHSAG